MDTKIDETAKRLYEVANCFDPYGARDADWSISQAKEMIVSSPLTLINELLTIIEELQEE